MSYTVKEKAVLAMQSLLDCCELTAAYSGGKTENEAFEAYFVPETMWYNRVYLHAAAKENLEATVDAVSADVKAGKLPILVSWLGSDFEETNLKRLLKKNGFADPLPVQKAMYLDLAKFTPAAGAVEVESVPAELVGPWSDMVAEAFGKPTEKPGMLLIAADPNCDFLMYREDGKIVAGMLLICKDGNAGVHEVGTLEAYRGRGIASALMNRAMAIAKEKGCTCATLQASPMGAPLYESLGFEAVDEVFSWLMLPPEGMAL